MRFAISQVCSLEAPFETDLEDYAAGGCDAVEVWLTKLENYVAAHSIDAARRLAGRHGLTLVSAAMHGGVLASQGEARREAWSLLDTRLDLCRQLQIGTIVVACDVPRPLDAPALERVRVSLAELARQAERHEVRIALEFQAAAALGNNLQTAAELVGEVRSTRLGLCLDVFHFFTGPSKTEDLESLPPDLLFHVQWADLAGVPRELAADADRVLPGDGDLPLALVARALERLGYDGVVALELMNPRIWLVPPRQLADVALTALRRTFDSEPLANG